MSVLSVVVVSRNENLSIGSVMDSLCKNLETISKRESIECEIVLIDDSDDMSTVDAANAAITAASTHLRTNFIHRLQNERDGLTGAIFHGIRLAKGDKVVVMDGDGQHPSDLIPQFFTKLKDSSIVFASRYLINGGDAGLSNAIRRLASRTLNRFLTGALGKRVQCTDPLTGFFGIDKSRVTVPATSLGGWKAAFLILAHNLTEASPDIAYGELAFAIKPRIAGESKLSLLTSLQVMRELRAAAKSLS